jgi:hypothetical protein
MGGSGIERTQITVALVGGRRLRELCLARFLEISGICIKIGEVQRLRERALILAKNQSIS